MNPIILGIVVALVVWFCFNYLRTKRRAKTRLEEAANLRRFNRPSPIEPGWSSRTSTPAARKTAEKHRDDEYQRTMAVPDPLFDDPDDLLPAKVALLRGIATDDNPATRVAVEPVARQEAAEVEMDRQRSTLDASQFHAPAAPAHSTHWPSSDHSSSHSSHSHSDHSSHDSSSSYSSDSGGYDSGGSSDGGSSSSSD